MKYIRRFNENLQEDLQEEQLALEFENKIRTLDSESDFTVDDFFNEFGVDEESRTDFAWAAILKQAEEYKDLSDDDFYNNYYNPYKEKLA